MQRVIQGIFIFCFVCFQLKAAESGYQYIYPAPEATRVSPNATIIIRFDTKSPTDLSNQDSFVRVADERGSVSGDIHLASDQKTFIFRPDAPFELGSSVSVSLLPRFKSEDIAAPLELHYKFHITASPAIFSGFVPEDERHQLATDALEKSAHVSNSGPRVMPNGVSVPSDFPHINVMTNIAPGEGYIFLNNRGRGTPYNIIFDNDGSPVWYLRTDDRRRDFKVQRNGTISMLARHGGHRFLNFDKNFNFLGEYSAVDGYSTDEHECVILEDGHVLLIGRREEKVDMSQYVTGGRRNATVRETVVQEFTPNHEKIFEWRAWDHFEDIIQHIETEDLTGGYIRFPHMNALDIDDDGHLVLSSRNFSEISKINRQTGEFIWRLGGPKNEFTFINDDLGQFKNQHAILCLGNNRYTLFDNGTIRRPRVSRGVEYVLDPEKKTATLVWEYRNPPGTDYSHYMGNHQRLPDGNSLINWAIFGRPKATEVTPDGEVVYEMNWASPDECYRAFRFPWDGVVDRPNLFVEAGGDHVILLFNKFGDKNIDYYKIYGGTTPNSNTVLDTSRATMKGVRNLENGRVYYFRVTAVSNDGKESAPSRQESIYVNLKTPGENQVLNDDFSRSKRNWNLENHNSADASWTAVTREGHVQIANGGLDRRSVIFYQGQMNMVQGVEYLLEFEAYADVPRVIEAMVCHPGDPDHNYSRIGYTALKDRKQKYSFVFTMTEHSDYNAELRFHLGSDDADVYLDNVVLRENIPAHVEEEEHVETVPSDFALIGNFPNPFNPQTSIRYELPEQSDVMLSVYNLLGTLVHRVEANAQSAGRHHLLFDASQLSSGVYIYQVEARSLSSQTTFRDTKKMMIVK